MQIIMRALKFPDEVMKFSPIETLAIAGEAIDGEVMMRYPVIT